jgi:hypothetical protein
MTKSTNGNDDNRNAMKNSTNGQRALWATLLTSLVAPAIASIIAIALAIASQAFGLTLSQVLEAPLSEVAVGTYVWAAFPVAISALALLPFVLQTGTYGWLHAAVSGVLGFMAAAIIFPFQDGGMLPVFAFLAGLTIITMREFLIKIGILYA